MPYSGSTSETLFGWAAGSANADTEIRSGTEILRNRVRALERNDSFMRRWLQSHARNVVGPKGFSLESRARSLRAREIIEGGWEDWKRAANCTTGGRMPYCELKILSEKAVARDGGVFLRVFPGFEGNTHRFALQLLEVDHLDMRMRRTAPNGAVIRGGVEVDGWNRPVAYHLHDQHPGEVYYWNTRIRTRVPAQDMLHRYYSDRPEQTYGASLASAAVLGLKHLSEYAGSEAAAARAHADSVNQWVKDEEFDEDPDEYDPLENIETGPLSVINPPKGVRLENVQPQHPNSSFPEFQRSMAIYLAAGLMHDYPTFTGDLAQVSFSGLRHGVIDVQSLYQGFQNINIETEERWVFERWLANSLTFGTLPGLEFSEARSYYEADFIPAGLPWVDPQKEIAAAAMEIEKGLNAKSLVVRQRLGMSYERLLEIRQRDRELEEQYGEKPEVAEMVTEPEIEEPEQEEEDEQPQLALVNE